MEKKSRFIKMFRRFYRICVRDIGLLSGYNFNFYGYFEEQNVIIVVCSRTVNDTVRFHWQNISLSYNNIIQGVRECLRLLLILCIAVQEPPYTEMVFNVFNMTIEF